MQPPNAEVLNFNVRMQVDVIDGSGVYGGVVQITSQSKDTFKEGH